MGADSVAQAGDRRPHRDDPYHAERWNGARAFAYWRTLLSANLVAVLAFSACSPDPVEQYLNHVGEITQTMRRDSIVALPDPSQPTPESVSDVIDARRSATNALESMAPPIEIRPEHAALVLALSELTDAGDRILAETTRLDLSAFTTAIESATALQEMARRVTIACVALETRAEQLGYDFDLRC